MRITDKQIHELLDARVARFERGVDKVRGKTK
jgi:hypothetical protein